MQLPEQKSKYSYADYLAWDEGIRLEIIEGIVYMQAAPSRIHQEVLMEISKQFAVYLTGKSCRVYPAPFCVRLDVKKNNEDIKNVVEPDISIVCDKFKLDERGCNGAPDMIVEILSPSTGKTDRLLKFNMYEKSGVKEYWIVEPDQKIISVFTLQSNERYGRPQIYSEEEKIKVSIFQDFEINLKTIFMDIE